MVLLRSLFNSQWDIRGVVLQLQINKTMKGAIVVLGLLRHGCAI